MIVMPGAELDRPVPFAGGLADLATAHRMVWLAQVLPPGACLMWACGPSLAAAVAGDGSRTVLLLEPAPGGAERALAQGAPGVSVRDAQAYGRTSQNGAEPFASLVVALDEHDDPAEVLPGLLGRLHRRGAIAVVHEGDTWPDTLELLQGAGRRPSIVHQGMRVASCIGVGDDLVTAVPDASLHVDADDPFVIVTDGLLAEPSVLLGGPARPPVWATDAEEAVDTLRRFDEQVSAERLTRVRELEGALAAVEADLAAAHLESRDLALQLEAVLTSTSWRLSAPGRWASDAVALLRRRRRGS